MGRLDLNVSVMKTYEVIPRLSSTSLFHDLEFFVQKLNICLGYILHEISLLLWRSPVLKTCIA